MSDPSEMNLSIGPFTYHCVHDWPKLDKGYAWGITHAVATDRNERIYIAHTANTCSRNADTVYVFDPHGNFLNSWGTRFNGSAHGLEIVEENGTEFAYLTDLDRGLFKLTLDGKVIWHFEKPELYRKAFGLNWKPSNVALADNTDLYLSDGYGSGFIVRIDRNTGEEISLFAGPGSREECLIHPHGLTIDSRGGEATLLVADNVVNRFCFYDLNGHYLGSELVDDESLIAPRHFTWWNNILIVPDLGGRINFYDSRNALVGSLGEPELPFQQQVAFHDQPASTFPTGNFRLPHDVCVDGFGNLYVVEWIQGGRVSKLQLLS